MCSCHSPHSSEDAHLLSLPIHGSIFSRRLKRDRYLRDKVLYMGESGCTILLPLLCQLSELRVSHSEKHCALIPAHL